MCIWGVHLLQVGDEIEEVYVTATAFDPEAKEANDYDTANTHLKFKVTTVRQSLFVRSFVRPFLGSFRRMFLGPFV